MAETRARDLANVGVDAKDLASEAALMSLAVDVATLDAEKLDVAGGKILQVVLGTDTTERTTTSTSFVDAQISVSITPTSATSEVILLWFCNARATRNRDSGSNASLQLTIRRTANTSLSVASCNPIITPQTDTASGTMIGLTTANSVVGRDAPNTTSSVTYLGMFSAQFADTTVDLRNNISAGQLYAIEVSA